MVKSKCSILLLHRGAFEVWHHHLVMPLYSSCSTLWLWILTWAWSHALWFICVMQLFKPSYQLLAEYAVRVSSRIVAQIQDRVSTDWKWHVLAVCCPGCGCTRFDLVSVLWLSWAGTWCSYWASLPLLLSCAHVQPRSQLKRCALDSLRRSLVMLDLLQPAAPVPRLNTSKRLCICVETVCMLMAVCDCSPEWQVQ